MKAFALPQRRLKKKNTNWKPAHSSWNNLKTTLDENRKIFDEKRQACGQIRSEMQAVQRNQFEAEKKVAVADTSIQNLKRPSSRLKKKAKCGAQLKQLEEERTTKEAELESQKNRPETTAGTTRTNKRTDSANPI